jgi:hypothetical protein
MPGHRVHCYVDRLLFGKSYWRLHRALDKPVIFLGKRHRVLFHDGFSSAVIAQRLYPGDPRAVEAALVHVQLDNFCSSNPDFAKTLKLFAEYDANQRRTARRKTRSKRPKTAANQLREFHALIRKLVEVRRLARMLSE